MNKSIEKSSEHFIFPDIEQEKGEFERVAGTFTIDTPTLMKHAEEGKMVLLSDEIWMRLDNTDSNRFETGDWEQVAEFSTFVGRDWRGLKAKIDTHTPLDAPIIMHIGAQYHLVAGNTRLMVARAASIRPTVLLFNIESANQ